MSNTDQLNDEQPKVFARMAKAVGMSPPELSLYLDSLDDIHFAAVSARLHWLTAARPNQLAPHSNWDTWAVIAGRGFGKTRLGGEWLWWETWATPQSYSFVIAPTNNDLRGTNFEGESGLLKIIPQVCIDDYHKTNKEITLTNGSVIRGFSAEEPDRLRGPQCHRMWLDEFAAWGRNLQSALDMAEFGMRLGSKTQKVITTTPRPLQELKTILKEKGTLSTIGSTYDNKANLSKQFIKALQKYEGTKLGRQEIHAEILDMEEGGIVQRSQIRVYPANTPLPEFDQIIVSMDTAYTEKTVDRKTYDPDPTACSVWGTYIDPKTRRTHVMLIDAWQDHLSFPELIIRAKTQMNKSYGFASKPVIHPQFGPTYLRGSGRKPDLLIIEDKGSGISLRQYLAKTEGIEAYPYNPGKADKLERLHLVSNFFAMGLVYIPGATEKDKEKPEFPDGNPFRPFSHELIAQICTFAGGGSIKHDDFVDTTTQALRVMSDLGYLVAEPLDEDDLETVPLPANAHKPTTYDPVPVPNFLDEPENATDWHVRRSKFQVAAGNDPQKTYVNPNYMPPKPYGNVAKHLLDEDDRVMVKPTIRNPYMC